MMQTRTPHRVQCLPPIASEKSKVLILGSMPGEESLKARQYYAHRQNKFWPIMGELFGVGLSLPYQDRVARLESEGVALWDKLHECEREGSSDVAITKEVANDFPAFFTKHPNITHVFFNGKEAHEKFRRHVLPSLAEDQHIYKRLPSTSPLYTITLDRKVQAWRVVVEALTALPPASKPKKSIR